MRARSTWCLAAALATATASAHAQPASREWRLAFVVETEELPGPEAESRPASRTAAIERTVGLADTYFHVLEGKQRKLWDFSGKRVLHLDLGKKEFVSASIYAGPAFRVFEMQNRMGIAEVLGAAGVTDEQSSFAPIDLEIELGLRFPGSEERDIARTESEGVVRFAAGETTLTTCVFSDTEVPAPHARMFERFLVYEVPLHPQVRRAIVEARRVPKVLECFGRRPGGQIRHRLELKKVSTGSRVGVVPPEGFRPAAGEGTLAALLRDASGPIPGAPTKPEAFVAIGKDSLAKGRPLDAILAAIERGLQSGDRGDPGAEVREIVGKIREDPLVRKYLEATGDPDHERAIATLAAIPRDGLVRGHMLDLAAANHLADLGRTDEAFPAFEKALRGNMHLAPAWRDLGKCFSNGYDTVSAWICYDAARRVAPDHPMLADVTELERRFENDFPEFF